jgi:hypothetical protein
MFSGVKQCNGYKIYNGRVRGFPKFFVIPCIQSPNLTTCPSNPGAREPISVAIPFDLPRKKGALMQPANVSLDKTKGWTTW